MEFYWQWKTFPRWSWRHVDATTQSACQAPGQSTRHWKIKSRTLFFTMFRLCKLTRKQLSLAWNRAIRIYIHKPSRWANYFELPHNRSWALRQLFATRETRAYGSDFFSTLIRVEEERKTSTALIYNVMDCVASAHRQKYFRQFPCRGFICMPSPFLASLTSEKCSHVYLYRTKFFFLCKTSPARNPIKLHALGRKLLSRSQHRMGEWQ